MSQRSFQGKFSPLVPAISFAGGSWGGVIVWDNNPGSVTVPDGIDRGDTTIVSGTVHSVDDLGSGRKVVWFKRAAQRFSYTKVVAPGDSQEIEYDAFMGGNICQNIEPWRGYSWCNDRSFRGSDSLDRVEPGHAAWWEGVGVEVLDIRPFGKAPASVSFGAETPSPTISYYDLDINNVFLSYPEERNEANPEAAPYFTPEDTGAYSDCAVLVGGSFVVADRVTFTTPEAVSDPDYYPDDASFSTSAAEYWFDPVTKQIRLGSGTATVGDDVTVVYYHRDLREFVGEDLVVYTLEGSGAGYGVTDELAAMHGLTTGDFDYQFFIYKGAANNYGTGAIEWRVGNAANSQLVTMRWTEDEITSIKKRDSLAGTLDDVTFSAPPAVTGPAYFLVRVVKVDGNLSFYYQDQDDVSATLLATIALTDVEELTNGFVGLTTWGDNVIKVLGWDGEKVRRVELGAGEGVISRQVIDTYTDIVYTRTFTLPASEAITSVAVVGGGDFAMTDSATVRRDTYETPTGTTITFKSETSGARVKVVQAAPATAPGGTGRIPRLGGTLNMATVGEDGINASENVNENVANWYDGVLIYDPHDEFNPTEGDAVTFKNNVFASELHPPSIQYDVKNRVSNWAAVPPGDSLSRWVEGRTLISSTLLATLPETSLACFRAEGAIYYQDGGMGARQMNDLDKALEAFDNFSIGLSMGGGEVTSVKGISGPIYAGVTAVACNNYGGTPHFVDTGVGWGQTLVQLNRPYRFDPPAIKPPYPFWHSGLWYDASVRNEGDPTVMTCGSDVVVVQDLIVDGGYNLTVSPIGLISDVGLPYASYFGATCLPDYDGDHVLAMYATADFKFQGIAFMPGEELKRILGGATCLEAKVEVVFSGLRCETSQLFWRHGSIDLEEEFRQTVNGGVILEYAYNAAGALLYKNVAATPDAPSIGDVSFALIGRRRRSANVLNHDGTLSPLPAHEYSFLGSVTASAAEDGKRVVIDIAGLINALIADRGSNLTDYMLWPTIAGVSPGASAQSLGDFIRSLMPSGSASIIETVDWKTRKEYAITTNLCYYDDLEISNVVYCRFRYPSGIVTDLVPVPFVWPKAMA